MKEYSLPVRTLLLWRIRLTAVAAPIIAAVLCLRPKEIFVAAAGFLSAVFLFFLLYYLPKLHKSYKIVLGNGFLAVFYGVFIKTEKIVPQNRTIISHRTVTPLLRLMKLERLCFSAVRKNCPIAPVDGVAAEEILNHVGGCDD
ncbi:MAG: hypothetical protein IJ426_04740 [Clostridia bacterium]|nr:hypothetical protein [Clostridia bacterium]